MEQARQSGGLLQGAAAEVARIIDFVTERAPMLLCAIGLMIGILAEVYWRPGWPIPMALALIVIFASIALLFLPLDHRRAVASGVLAAAGFAVLGAVRANTFVDPPRDNIVSICPGTDTIADIRGVIVSDIRLGTMDTGSFSRRDPGSSFELQLRQILCLDGWQPVRGTVRVYVGELVWDLQRGDSIEVKCILRPISAAMNPGQFDTAAYHARQGIHRTAFARGRSALTKVEMPKAGRWIFLVSNWLRLQARTRIVHGDADDDAEGLLHALLLGVRSDISPAVHEAFRQTGLLHYISLSGLHVGILTGVLWWLAKVIGMRRKTRAVIVSLALFAFLMIVPWRAPILRAAIICFVFAAAELVGRRGNSANTLAIAAVLILAFRPLELFAVGWQLSFSCMVGILLLARPMARWFSNWPIRFFARRPLLDTAGRAGPLGFLWQTSAATLGMGMAAWLGGGPVMLYHFHTITPLAALWTVLTFPLAAGVVTFGFAGIVGSAISPTMGAFFSSAAASLANGFIWLVELAASLGISEIVIGHVPLWSMLLAMAAVFYVGAIHWPGPRSRRWIVIVMATTAVVSLAALKTVRLFDDEVEITVLSVGHGQSIVINLPGQTLLLDAGSSNVYACGRRILIPYMRWSGRRTPKTLFVSHAHDDHYNFGAEAVEAYPAMSVSVSSGWKEQQPLTLLGHDAESVGRLTAGDTLAFGNAAITVLWPVAGQDATALSENDASLVLLLEYAGRRVLFCSDIEHGPQRRIMQLYPDLEADVIVLPHHGSNITTDPAFIESVAARIEVCSCDKAGMSRSLDPLPGAERYSTASHGAITIQINSGGGLSVRTFCSPDVDTGPAQAASH